MIYIDGGSHLYYNQHKYRVNTKNGERTYWDIVNTVQSPRRDCGQHVAGGRPDAPPPDAAPPRGVHFMACTSRQTSEQPRLVPEGLPTIR